MLTQSNKSSMLRLSVVQQCVSEPAVIFTVTPCLHTRDKPAQWLLDDPQQEPWAAALCPPSAVSATWGARVAARVMMFGTRHHHHSEVLKSWKTTTLFLTWFSSAGIRSRQQRAHRWVKVKGLLLLPRLYLLLYIVAGDATNTLFLFFYLTFI